MHGQMNGHMNEADSPQQRGVRSYTHGIDPACRGTLGVACVIQGVGDISLGSSDGPRWD